MNTPLACLCNFQGWAKRGGPHLAEGEDEPVKGDLDAEQHEQRAEEEVGHVRHQAERDGEQQELRHCEPRRRCGVSAPDKVYVGIAVWIAVSIKSFPALYHAQSKTERAFGSACITCTPHCMQCWRWHPVDSTCNFKLPLRRVQWHPVMAHRTSHHHKSTVCCVRAPAMMAPCTRVLMPAFMENTVWLKM